MKIVTGLQGDKDLRNYCPEDQEIGSYYIFKKNKIAQFTFGKESSSFKTCKEAFEAMRHFLSKRKDADELTVSLLNNYFG